MGNSVIFILLGFILIALSMWGHLVCCHIDATVPKYEDKFISRNSTAVCQYCGKPIYYAQGSEIWWEIYEPAKGYDRTCTHVPTGVNL